MHPMNPLWTSPSRSPQKLLYFHIQNSNNVIKRTHYCHLLCGAALCTMSAWKAKSKRWTRWIRQCSKKLHKSTEMTIFIRLCVWHKYNMSLSILQCVRRTVFMRQTASRRAQPSLDQLNPAQLDPAGTNPSSQPLNHRAANKTRRQYITGMWQALAIMTLRSPLGL